jgi:arylsulfatase
VVPPKGAPNVLLIMTDDVGFGSPSTFGGIIPTPNLDSIAKIEFDFAYEGDLVPIIRTSSVR